MQKRIHFIGALLLVTGGLFAQNDSLYMHSDADRVETSLYKNIDSRLDEIKKQSFDEYRDVRLAALQNFISTSAFEANQLQGGNSIFNKEASEMVQKVMDRIISKNSQDYDIDVRCYVAKSQVVNAYATDNGNIWVTLGLLSRVNNEAELAFVLCHEVSHYLKKHSYDKVTTATKDILKGDFDLVGVHDFSKDKELEADELGYELYLNCDYDLQSISTVFDVLSKSLLPHRMERPEVFFPFSNLPVDEDLIRNPREFDQDELEKEDNDYSTHPSLWDRREAIATLKESLKESGHDKTYIELSEAEFNSVKAKALYTISDLYIMDNDYLNGISHNDMLLKLFPNDPFVKYNLMMAWVQASYYSKLDVSDDVEDYLYGENFVLYKVFAEIPEEVLFANVILSAQRLHDSDPENANYTHAFHAALFMMARHYDETQLTKRELLDILDNKKTKDVIALLEEEMKAKEVRELFAGADDDEEEVSKEEWTLRGNEEKIIFINPNSMIFDQSSLFPYDLKQSNEAATNLSRNLKDVCRQYGIPNEVLALNNDLENDPSMSEDAYITRKIFQSADLNFDSDDDDDVYFNVYLSPSNAKRIMDKYDCRYVGYVLELEENPGEFNLYSFGLKLYYSAAFIMTYPMTIIGTFIEQENLTYIMIVYDLQENKYVYADGSHVPSTISTPAAKKMYLQSLIYDALK